MACVFQLLHWSANLLSLFLSLGLWILWDTKILKLGQLITLKWPVDVQVKEWISSLSLCIKSLEWFNIVRKAYQKPNRLKVRPPVPNSYPSCECKVKVLEGNQKCYSSQHINKKKAKQPYCWFEKSFSGLSRRTNQPQHFLKPKPNPEPRPNSLQFTESQERWEN